MVSWNMTTVVYWPEIILGNLTNKEDQTIDMLHLNLYGTRLLARLMKQVVFSKLHNNTASRGGQNSHIVNGRSFQMSLHHPARLVI